MKAEDDSMKLIVLKDWLSAIVVFVISANELYSNWIAPAPFDEVLFTIVTLLIIAFDELWIKIPPPEKPKLLKMTTFEIIGSDSDLIDIPPPTPA